MKIADFKYSLAYIALIVLVNYGFSVVPLLDMWTGEKWPPMSLAVGLIFVIRDFAQREIGHKIWGAMGAAGVLSYLMADPFVAIASVVAFAISEAADWAIYSFTRKPFAQRILLSSVISTPLDSAVFLAVINHLSWSGVIAMTVSKMIAALIVWQIVRKRRYA